jgi:uncharacterized protein YdaU (DUF1376 family)
MMINEAVTQKEVTKGKSPAFRMYASDFIMGCATMETWEVGAYIRLLCYQWENFFIKKDEKFLKKITGISAKKLQNVLTKFKQNNEGNYFNERMERERLKQQKNREIGKENGEKGGRPKNRKRTQKKPNEEPKQEPKKNLSVSASVSVSGSTTGTDTNVSVGVKPPRATKPPGFKAPSTEEVVAYFRENGYHEAAGQKAWAYYNAAGWKDSKGSQVKNWKQKMQGVWFKDENKTRSASATGRNVIMLTVPFAEEEIWPEEKYERLKHTTEYKFLRYES